jgi:coenzyme PQQ precursor peptide PqqA
MEARRLHPFASESTELQVNLEGSTEFSAKILNEEKPNLGGNSMTWKAPKIVELRVGMEINMYACAARK